MSPLQSAALVAEIARVLRVFAAVEHDRTRLGTSHAVAAARRRGARAIERTAGDRECLRRAIGIVDRRVEGGNCYRRALLEMSLDRGAAREVLYLDLQASGERDSGHARLESWPHDGRQFDATFEL
jgi:hypothetical protein